VFMSSSSLKAGGRAPLEEGADPCHVLDARHPSMDSIGREGALSP
jgi:hypothetical protein